MSWRNPNARQDIADAAEVERLREEIDRLRRAALCDICAGTGSSGTNPCACGGTGQAQDAVIGIRKMYFDAETQLKEIRELVLPNDPDESHAELMKELRAWDAHSDANLRNLQRVSELCEALKQAAEALDELLGDCDTDSNRISIRNAQKALAVIRR